MKYLKLEKVHPEIHETLYDSIEHLWEEKSLEFNPPSFDISQCLSERYLTTNDGLISFSDKELMEEYLALHVVERILLPDWGDIEKFEIAFNKVQDGLWKIQKIRLRNRVIEKVLFLLHNIYNKNVVNRVSEAAEISLLQNERSRLFWDLFIPFTEILPQLKINHNFFSQKINPILQAIEKDTFMGSFFKAIEGLAGRSEQLAYSLYRDFVKEEGMSFNLAGNALVALSKFNLDKAHDEAFNLINSDDIKSISIGIGVLSRIKYQEKETDSKLQDTLEKFDELRNKENKEIDKALVRSYAELLKKSEHAPSKAIFEYAQMDDPEIQSEVASVLFTNNDEFSDKKWFQDSLLALSNISLENKSSIRFIDWCLSSYTEQNLAFVFKFLKAFVLTKHPKDFTENKRLPKLFHGTFAQINAEPLPELYEEITQWLFENEPSLHTCARDILQEDAYRALKPPTPPYLSKNVLDKLKEKEVVVLAKRVMGYFHHSITLASLLVSVLHRKSCSNNLKGFVKSTLRDYVLYNYPGEGRDFLEEKLKEKEIKRSQKITKVIKEALNESDQYYQELKQLPYANEFRPPRDRLYILRREQSKRFQKDYDKPSDEFPLLNLSTKVPIKYGNIIFHSKENSFSDPTPLTLTSVNAEFPRGELIDPIGQNMLRFACKTAGYPKQNTSNQ